VQLSVLMPTRRTGLAAVSRIAQVCSWAGPDVEVIVRDNSGDAEKRALISRFQGENCRVVLGDPCEPLENMSEVLRLATGEFIFCPHDDDLCFDRAVAAVPSLIKEFSKDSSVSGIAGQVIIEAANNSSLARYAGLDSDDVVARVNGYVDFGGPNALLYSVIRREIYQRIMSFMNGMPVFLSFHDQIVSLLFVLCGKFIQLPRLLYAYDVGVWGTRDTAQQRDVDYYRAAGLDPVLNMLQWLLCAFEGAVLIRNSDLFPNYPMAQRQKMADRWFATKFSMFVGDKRSAFGSKYESGVQRILTALFASKGQLSFRGLLTEICNVIALFSNDKANLYSEFWKTQIEQAAAVRGQATKKTAA
jgi:hypothetical protein